MKFKRGTDMSNMSDKITGKYADIDRVYQKHTGHEATVTSGREGKHQANSLHYTGEAIDLRIWNMTKEEVGRAAKEIKKTLGRHYDIVVKSNCIHVEYQYKPIEARPRPRRPRPRREREPRDT